MKRLAIVLTVMAALATACGDDSGSSAATTGSASSQVFSSAQSLSREGTVLKQEVEKFLAMVRAA